MKLFPILKQLLRENKLELGNYWVDDNAKFHRFSCTHGDFVMKNLDKFNPSDNIEFDEYGPKDPRELYAIAFDNGWVRLVVNRSSFGKAANVQFNKHNVNQKALSKTLNSIMDDNPGAIYIDALGEDADLNGGDVYNFGTDDPEDNEREMEDFLKKYGRYLR